MGHLLVTNDFPPKVGGIQTYLWDLWSRLPADEVTVLTTPHPDAPMFDAAAACRIERVSEPVLLPTPATARRIRALADEVGAGIVLLDPALPIGALGPALGRPYGLVLHGAEVTVPGRTVAALPVLRRTLRGAALVVAAGGYPLAEGERARFDGPLVLAYDGERDRVLAAGATADVSVVFDKYSLCVEALNDGRVQAVTTDDIILLGFVADSGGKLKIVGKPFTSEPYGIGLKKGDTVLRTYVNDILDAAYADGTWKAAYDKTVGKSGQPAPTPPPVNRY